LCDYSSYKRADLEKHSKAVHLGIKDFKCDICDKAFSRKETLVGHVKRIHKQLKNYSCELCSFTACTKHELEKHLILKHAHQHDDGSDDLLGSVAGPVIQATGKSTFEDGLRSGGSGSDLT
jgi:hypothetical protein